MDRKKHPFFMKPFRTPTMRPARDHNKRQNDNPELSPPPRERLPHRQNLGMSVRGSDIVTNRSSALSQPVDDVPFDDFGRSRVSMINYLLIRTY